MGYLVLTSDNMLAPMLMYQIKVNIIYYSKTRE